MAGEETGKKKRRELVIWAIVILLGLLVLAALAMSDRVFFVFLFILLIGIGLVYGIKKNRYATDKKHIPGAVAGLAVLQVFFIAITLIYLAQAGEYVLLLRADPISSLDNLLSVDDGDNIFVQGRVSEKNEDHAGIRAENCAIYSERRDYRPDGPDRLIIEMADGPIEVSVRSTLVAEKDVPAMNRAPLVLERDCFLRTCWKCLKIGHPVSIRGTVYQSQGTPDVRAEQIYSGDGDAHIGYLKSNTPFFGWSFTMTVFSLICFIGFLGIFVYYSIQWIKLKRAK